MRESAKEFWQNAYQSNIGKLIGTCYRYTRNHQLSEDLAHDAFLKAIDKLGTFEGKGKFEAWLRRIVVNHALQYLRNKKKDPYLVDLMPDIEPIDEKEEHIHPVESVSFTMDELIDTIGQLPGHHRLVFNLYVLDEFTHAEIGKELGISEGTSKSHLARARKKLKQLLVQKAEVRQDAEKNKKAFVLLLTSDADEYMDQTVLNCVNDFSILPKHPLSLESIEFNNTIEFRSKSFLRSNTGILTISVIAVISIVILLIVTGKNKDQQILLAAKEENTDIAEHNPSVSPSQTATKLPDSVIPERNLKQKQMKPLDSLALMLALSSAPLNSVTAKDSIKNEIENHSYVETKLSIDSVSDKPPVNSVITPNESKKESGTFSASELHWSEENMEVYFKGKVRVNFKEQHFQGKGSFTFLGKVHLLIVDEQQVTLGKKLKLANEDYHLVTLDSKAATEKYGDKGVNGAVEISRSR